MQPLARNAGHHTVSAAHSEPGQLSLSRCDSRSKLMSPTCAGLLVGPGELWRPDTVPIPWQDHCRCHLIAHDEVAPDEFSSHGKATCRP